MITLWRLKRDLRFSSQGLSAATDRYRELSSPDYSPGVTGMGQAADTM
jgi:hypothetical protein